MHLLNQWLPEPLAQEVAETEPGRFRAVVAAVKATWQESRGLPGGGGTLKWVSVVNRSVAGSEGTSDCSWTFCS